MKMIFHHFWKNVRASRWILGAWGLLLFVTCWTKLNHMDLTNEINLKWRSPFFNFFNILEGFTGPLLLIHLIQLEPISNSTSFWSNRPIPTSVSVISKLLFITVLICIPGLLTLVFMEGNSENVVFVSGTALITIWLATCTRSVSQFVVYTVIGMVTIAYIQSATHFPASYGQMTLWGIYFRQWVYFVGLALAVALQHGCRKLRLGLILGAGSLLAAVFGP